MKVTLTYVLEEFAKANNLALYKCDLVYDEYFLAKKGWIFNTTIITVKCLYEYKINSCDEELGNLLLKHFNPYKINMSLVLDSKSTIEQHSGHWVKRIV